MRFSLQALSAWGSLLFLSSRRRIIKALTPPARVVSKCALRDHNQVNNVSFSVLFRIINVSFSCH